jgi:hypothetical protein
MPTLPGRAPIFLRAALGAGILGWALPAGAQMVLPGASEPTPVGQEQAPPVRKAKPKPKVEPVRAASEDAVAGRTLLLNGSRGKLVIERSGGGVSAQVTLAGEKISAPTESCSVDLGAGNSLALQPAGRPEGTLRYDVTAADCPFQIDILEGAVLASGPSAACRFQAADCEADPRGMWGPTAADLEPRVAEIEAARASADKAVRASFKELLARVQKTKDKVAIRTLAGEQAGFTSNRDMVCRDYSREAAHGFCSARYTEFRAAALSARLGNTPVIAEAGKPAGMAGTAVAAGSEAPKPKAKPRMAPKAGALY